MPNYTLLNHSYQLTQAEVTLLLNYPPARKEQWVLKRYELLKQNIKANLILGQHDRCAYCRKIVEAAAKYEPLEHIVAKSIKVTWMFAPQNIIVTCDSCNNLKGDDQTLAPAFQNAVELPQVSDAYVIFNPHFDEWSHHLRYEDDIFLVAVPNSKGSDTIRICKLYRFNIVVNRAKELKVGQQNPAKRALQRLKGMDKNSADYIQLRNELFNAMDHFIARMDDNPLFN